MSKEKKSGFLNQGSWRWGLGVGLALGTTGYLLYCRPHREAISQNPSHPPIHPSSEGNARKFSKRPF